jgi:gliding motility-associated-like protein
MNNPMVKIRGGIIAVLLVLTGWSAQATHIVGGSLTYRCLGNDTFEIVLTLYTDCMFGQAPYDNPAWVGVFNQDGQIVDTIFMRLTNKIDTLEQSDPCFESVPNICVRVTQYKEVIVLPLLAGGYHLGYQRCCRNGTIQNIPEPIKVGATYWLYIPENTLKSCNSAPIWTEDPPIFVCVNEPLIFNYSAIDVDGDSLSYELINTYTGGVYLNNPKPTPPFGPPYDTVPWLPPYSLNNLMGGVPLSIDPVTGLMTGTPNTLGQFVVAVKVTEFRNGVFIGETFRDFQYNVVPCKVTNACINVADTILCDEFFVQFQNCSSEADFFLWEFGEGGETSNDPNPSYTFPDTGTWVVTLVAGKGAFCLDTTQISIFIQRNSIEMCMDVRVPECEEEIIITLTDCSTDSVSPLIIREWTFTTPDTALVFSDASKQIILKNSALAVISLYVESENGCIGFMVDTIPFNLINPPDLVPDTVNLCYLEQTTLNPNFDPFLLHTWSPDTFLLDPANTPNPGILAFETILYTVTYTDSVGLCIVEREVLLTVVDDLPEVRIMLSIPQCVDTAILFATLDTFPPDLTVTWEVITEKDVFVGGGNGIEVIITSSQEVIVCASISTDSCLVTYCDTIQVNILPDLDLGDTLVICLGDTIQLNPGGPSELVYSWSPTDFMDDPKTVSPRVWPPSSRLYAVIYTDTVGLCIVHDSVYVQVNDSTKLLEFTWDIRCDGQTVDFFNQSVNILDFFWEFGDPSTTGDTSSLTNPTWVYPGPGTYLVTLTTPDQSVCPVNDSLTKELVIEEAVNEADFTYDFFACGFPTLIQFFGTAFSTYGVQDGWFWDFGPYGTSTALNPVITVTESINLTVTLIVTWDSLCVDTVVQVLEIEVFDLDLPDEITVCRDSCIRLNPYSEPGWVFTWSPASWVDDVNSPSPLVCPDTNGLLTVEVIVIQPGGDTCILLDTIRFVVDPCEWDCEMLPPDLASCLDTIEYLINDCDGAFTLIWCTPDGDTLAIGPKVVIPMRAYEFIILKKFGPYGYIETDTIELFFLQYTVPVTADADPRLIFKGESSQLIAISPTAVSFEWTPAESLDNPFIFNPRATPDTCEIYTVQVTDVFGCTGQDTVLLKVRSPICDFPYIFVPNTFTPNGDGLNDVLYVRGDYIDELELYIYNRWGQLVFETRDKNVGWDGTFKGELLRTDVFGYYLKCICYGQEEYFTRGNVTLLRN